MLTKEDSVLSSEELDFLSTEFDYHLPKELIAQQPLAQRDNSRLLVVDRKNGSLKEMIFKDIINLLGEKDVLVLNDTKVIKARLVGRRVSGAKLEILLLKEKSYGIWEVIVKPGKRARLKEKIIFNGGKFYAEIIDRTPQGGRLLKFTPSDIKPLLKDYGKVPLPPYIKREEQTQDEEWYQTVYAREEGAVSCPTAGLHFTPKLLEKLHKKGVEITYITLHCGLGTFRPVKTKDIRDHQMDKEKVILPPSTAEVINRSKKEGKRVVAVGTTVVRTLETFSAESFPYLRPGEGETNLYILPNYKFKVVDSIITNFHTPRSTNLILVSAFMGKELTKRAYNFAIEKRYRFFSFGDAMFIV